MLELEQVEARDRALGDVHLKLLGLEDRLVGGVVVQLPGGFVADGEVL